MKNNHLLIYILAIGVFSILNTEMGIVGILSMLSEKYNIDIVQAGLLVSLFALGVAVAGPIFLTAADVGCMAGTSTGGWFIRQNGLENVVLAGIIFAFVGMMIVLCQSSVYKKCSNVSHII